MNKGSRTYTLSFTHAHTHTRIDEDTTTKTQSKSVPMNNIYSRIHTIEAESDHTVASQLP